ncbi:MAG: SulP family inorganic anion transporter [Planctomycetota bacterium]
MSKPTESSVEPSRAKASTWRGDVFGGITAGIVALPLALAFGVQSGLGAEYGLYGAILIGFFAAIFGGTAVQVSGPTGPMTVVTAVAIKEIGTASGGSLEAALPALVATFVVAGLIQIGMGLIGLGKLIKFIPYPVVSGFMSGIGVIIVLLQLFPAMGHANPDGGSLGVIRSLGSLFDDVNLAALLLTTATVAIIYLFPRITKVVPSALAALLLLTIVASTLSLDVGIIGTIPSGFPAMRGADIFGIDGALWPLVLKFGATLAALGAIDSLLTSVVADNLTKTRHNSRRELIGQGIGNTISGLFAGLPGAGATVRTVVNVNAGGRSRISGAVHAALLLIVLLGAGPYAAMIPKPVLAGILITVGIGILDYHGMLHLRRVPRSDAVVTLLVLLITVFSDLLVAVAVGMVVACFLFMKRMSEIVEDGVEIGTLRTFQDDHEWPDEHISAEIEDQIIIKRLQGPIFFGFAQALQESFASLPPTKYLVLRMGHVPFVDQSGVYALADALRELEKRGVTVLMSGLQSQPYGLLHQIGLIPADVPNNHVFPDFGAAIAFVRKALPAA